MEDITPTTVDLATLYESIEADPLKDTASIAPYLVPILDHHKVSYSQNTTRVQSQIPYRAE
jgi:hypothetical protein